MRSTSLHEARAVLLCRAGKHHEALNVLVKEVRDPQAAEAFCCRAAQGRSPDLRPTLLLNLLQIYLDSEEHAGADLINNNSHILAAEQVVRLLPDCWSVQLVSQFLIGSLRGMLHQRRMARLQTALSLAELTRHKVIRVSRASSRFLPLTNMLSSLALWLSPSQMQASKTKLRLDGGGQRCKVCDGDLAQPQFTRSLHGDVMHTSCVGSPSPP